MKMRLIRHATVLLELGGKKLLLDPVLSPAGAWDAVPVTPNPRKNPLVNLPIGELELEELLQNLDAVIITHTHGDHFDPVAKERLPKNVPVICQPCDVQILSEAGFTKVYPVEDTWEGDGIKISRTGGKHGKYLIGRKMGKVSGFVLEGEQFPKLYITGDTVWCKEVEQALRRHTPDVTIAFAGAAQFLAGGPITMDLPDIERICQTIEKGRVVAIHMEAFNHCVLTRPILRDFLLKKELENKVLVPEDGEWVEF